MQLDYRSSYRSAAVDRKRRFTIWACVRDAPRADVASLLVNQKPHATYLECREALVRSREDSKGNWQPPKKFKCP